MPYSPEVERDIARAKEEIFGNIPASALSAPPKPRILVVGTKVDVWKLKRQFGDQFEGRRVSYAAVLSDFWKMFLGSSDLSDTSAVSLPERIVATGYMRSYVVFAETIPVENELRKVAERFKIPLEFVPRE